MTAAKTKTANSTRKRILIVDDGKGITTLSPRRKGLGLRIMQYRAGLLQGTVTVRARSEGGTEVCCVAPAQMLLFNDGAPNRNPKLSY